jgi:hypothetical protein
LNLHYRYKVLGFGEVPEDMLRYDEARIETIFEREGHWRAVMVVGRRPPTKERWESFGWQAIEIATIHEPFPEPASPGSNIPFTTVEAW